jgi:hypothetical protein
MFAAQPSQAEPLPSEGADHPMEWVPTAGDAPQRQTIRPITGQVAVKAPTAFPLEYFDNPELELVPPRQRLAEAPPGAGLQAVSRFYDTQGSFSWAPCTVLRCSEYAPPPAPQPDSTH